MRERRNDVPLLVDHFIRQSKSAAEDTDVVPEALSLLINYAWPGNIRELRSVIESAINLSQGKPITPKHLPDQLIRKSASPRENSDDTDGPLPLAEVEKQHILKIYKQTGQNKSEAARLLEVSLSTLRRKLESYGIA